jgi:hypothetical protein
MSTTYSCLVESDLFDSKHSCKIHATTLQEFIENIRNASTSSVPQEQLLFEVYDSDFEEFVGE